MPEAQAKTENAQQVRRAAYACRDSQTDLALPF